MRPLRLALVMNASIGCKASDRPTFGSRAISRTEAVINLTVESE